MTEYENEQAKKRSKEFSDQIVLDAGTVNRRDCPEVQGKWGEEYACPSNNCGSNCSLCAGTGRRSVCNHTSCHEYGCCMDSCVPRIRA